MLKEKTRTSALLATAAIFSCLLLPLESFADSTLSVTKTGLGSGTVTSSPAGITCGADCSEIYLPGAAVSLTATPDAGSLFAGWSGDADCADGLVTMDAAKVCTASFVSELGEALDNTSLTWTTGGDSDWSSQTAVSIYGGSAAQTGDIAWPKWNSWMQTTVTGPATLSFYWKSSSGPTFDGINFFVDGVQQALIGVETDWQLVTQVLPSGSHTLLWNYTKTFANTDVSGKAWVDKVVVQPLIDNAVITATAPNGGEVWNVGTTHLISWNFAGAPGNGVKIELLKGTSVVSTIAKNAPIGSNGSGSYSWSIPSRQALGSDYKIRITGSSSSSYTDASDGVFSISKN